MTSHDLIERFSRQAPVAFLVRGLIDFAFAPHFLNSIADAARVTTYTRSIEFVHLVALLTDVVFRVHPSVRAAYRGQDQLHAVAGLKCFYDKLNHVEPAISSSFVRSVADRVEPLVGGCAYAEPLSGLRLRILDGNHLAATQRRLDGLEGVPSPLPGQALALLEHASGLISRVLPWEDAHANERSLIDQVLPWFSAGDCVVADSGFCTEGFFRGLIGRGAYFIVRHHGSVGLHPLKRRKRVGRSDTGEVYEYKARYAKTDLVVRVIEVELDQPTRAGQAVIRVLTNLKKKSALRVADIYLGRRRIETAFQELEAAMRSEVDTLAYPRAALLAFCVAAAVYNLLQVVRAGLEKRRLEDEERELSGTLMSQEVRTYLAGMSMALQGVAGLPNGTWDEARMRQWLQQYQQRLNLKKYAKSRRAEKKPREIPQDIRKDHHGATARILQQRREKSATP